MKGGKMKNMMGMMTKMMQGKAGGKGKVKGKAGKPKTGNNKFNNTWVSKDEVPEGAGRVFVRGFDFGTTDEQFEGHMKKAGKIVRVKWVTKGSAEVIFKTQQQAEKAVEKFDKTTIPGNSRFIDVILKDPWEVRD